ncbi:MAG: hypothetical protein NWF04_10555 [Candidatus Bathyarchaeota archaeon]|nr:hypothetical protein [Candidatus Bathyarchaeota archaeon]
MLKFKIEIALLLISIALFAVSTLCYSYATSANAATFAFSNSHPYRVYAIPFVSFGSVLMAAATLSYSKRSKNMV